MRSARIEERRYKQNWIVSDLIDVATGPHHGINLTFFTCSHHTTQNQKRVSEHLCPQVSSTGTKATEKGERRKTNGGSQSRVEEEKCGRM